MPEAHHPPIAHIEINAAHEFTVGARGHNDCLAHQHRLWQGVMRMPRQDHVDAGNAPGHLFIYVKAIVAEADNELGPLPTHLVDHGLHVFVTDAKAVFREHPARIGNGHIGKGLTDNGDLDPATFEELVGREYIDRLVPFGIKDVLSERRKGEALDNLLHTGGP